MLQSCHTSLRCILNPHVLDNVMAMGQLHAARDIPQDTFCKVGQQADPGSIHGRDVGNPAVLSQLPYVQYRPPRDNALARWRALITFLMRRVGMTGPT